MIVLAGPCANTASFALNDAHQFVFQKSTLFFKALHENQLNLFRMMAISGEPHRENFEARVQDLFCSKDKACQTF